MPLSEFAARGLLNLLVGGTAFAANPAAHFYALSHTTTPLADGTGVTEPVANGYARVSVTNNTTNFPVDAAGPASKANATVITFPICTIASWGGGANMTHVVVYDASTAGNFIGFGTLTVPKPVTVGDTASFAISALTWTLS